MSYLLQFEAGTHPVGFAATPVLMRLYGRETCPHRIVPRRGIFGKNCWIELIEMPCNLLRIYQL
jgi:hypothetical protein